MPERTLLRIGAASTIVGAVLAIVSNALIPRTPDPSDRAAYLRMVTESSLWTGDFVGLLVASLLLLGGLVALYRSITMEPGAALARLGFAGALVGSGIFLVWIAIGGYALKGVAEAWVATQGEVDKAVAFGVDRVYFATFAVWTIVFFGATFILYGLAVALTDVYPKWLGWWAVVGGIGAALVGIINFYNGPSFLVTNILFAVLSILLTVWLLAMGVLMWRRANAPA